MSRIYGLVGYPLGHSFSRRFFTEKFAAEGIDADYVNFEIDSIDRIGEVLATPVLCGFNVTIPYKRAIIPHLDSLDDLAKAVGAVNVVRVGADGTLTGYNSDVYGFAGSIRPLIQKSGDGCAPAGGDTRNRALVLGTGGASCAVVAGLRMLGIEPTLVSRSGRAGNYGPDAPQCIGYDQITDDVIAGHTIVVNATPLGMYPHTNEAPDIPYRAMTSRHVAFDLVYNPETTEFMRRAASFGATVSNGLGMLHLQAIRAWQIWNGTDGFGVV